MKEYKEVSSWIVPDFERYGWVVTGESINPISGECTYYIEREISARSLD